MSIIAERPVLAELDASSALGNIRSFFIDGPAGRLEALLNEGRSEAPYAALVAHPHPLGGGTMHNKVVYHAAKVISALGWPVLRFNFRGVGLSEGTHDGAAESGDVHAGLDWLTANYNRPIIAAGFSFGAAMTLAAVCGGPSAQTSAVQGVASLGLPTHAEGRDYTYPFLADCSIPKLFLSGDRDKYAPVEQLRHVVESAAKPKQLTLIPGADHFFTGHLSAMQTELRSWLEHTFSTAPPPDSTSALR